MWGYVEGNIFTVFILLQILNIAKGVVMNIYVLILWNGI